MPLEWLRTVLRHVRDPEVVERATYAYKVVTTDRLDDLQNLLDQHSVDGWRLRHTVQSRDHTVALIFEREQ